MIYVYVFPILHVKCQSQWPSGWGRFKPSLDHIWDNTYFAYGWSGDFFRVPYIDWLGSKNERNEIDGPSTWTLILIPSLPEIANLAYIFHAEQGLHCWAFGLSPRTGQQTVIYFNWQYYIVYVYTQSNLNGSNTFGTMKICSRQALVGWLVVLGLTALWDSISVYIGPSTREGERGEKR